MSDVKAKIKNIRTVYTREKKKTRTKKTGQGLDDVYVSKYPHFDSLHFLDDYMVAKHTVSNYKVSMHAAYMYNEKKNVISCSLAKVLHPCRN